MKKIEKLTKEQEKHLVEFRKKWLNIGLCCEPANFDKAEEQITFFYEKLGKKKPMFFRFSSPMTAELGCQILNCILKNREKFFGANLGTNLVTNLEENLWANLEANLGVNLWENLWENLATNLSANLAANFKFKERFFIETYLLGQRDCSWIAFYKFCNEIGVPYKKNDLELLNAWEVLSESASWWQPYENVCIISDRPRKIYKDENGRLHNENGMSVEFSDGWGIYTWHGTNIPDEWIKNKKSLTPAIVLLWENVEQRRIACEIIGWASVLEHPDLHPKIIDEDLPHIGTLIQVDLPDAPKQWFLKYQCGTGRWFAESVNDKMFNTALKANAAGNGWRPGLGEPEDFIPFIRT